MVKDPRSRYFRKLRRLRRSARWWSVVGMALTGAVAVLLPYHGIGMHDVFWAAGATGSLALAYWRWVDFRTLRAQGPPPAVEQLDPVSRVVGMLSRHPSGKVFIEQVRRQRSRARLKGSIVEGPAGRLHRASSTMMSLTARLDGPAASVVNEAAAIETHLWDVAQRASSAEQARQFAPAESCDLLDSAVDDLLAQFEEGVEGYERLVVASAAYVAEGARVGSHSSMAVHRLNEAVELLRAQTQGLAEVRDLGMA
ncbi:MAG: hypothetical protein H0T78_05165 [Longispora sp.]|nr:hypothetical protein [Longispora sp. (in: high G+C Gram-positive bacteria)]